MKQVFQEYGRLLLSAMSGVLMLSMLYGFFLAQHGAMAEEIRKWIQTFL